MRRRGAVSTRTWANRCVLVMGTIVVLVSGLLGAVSTRAASSSKVRNGLIFFERARGAAGDIFAIRPDGSGRHRVGLNGAEPWISPDGQVIAFQDTSARLSTGEYRLATARADGSHHRVIDTGLAYIEYPSFSPDGKEIIFDDGAHTIWAVNPDGSNVRPLVMLHHGLGPSQAVFTPDGKAIVFSESKLHSGSSRGRFEMNPDGTNVHALPKRLRSEVAFSPDGKTVLIACGNGICSMRLDGSHRRRLTRPPRPVPSNALPITDADAAFSPDGSKIVFVRHAGNLGPGLWDGPHGLFIMNANGSHRHQLNGNGNDAYPSWQALP